MKKILLSLTALFPAILIAQTWVDDVAPVVYSKCTSCHNDNGVAPFSLMDYQAVSDFSSAIAGVVANGYMPPWTADNNYQSYAHSRELSEDQKQTILAWISNGSPEGNPDNSPPPPIYENTGFIQVEADLELTMEPYTSQASLGSDDYVCISLPSGLTEDKTIRAFEVIPGNPSIVHHCLVYIDPTGTYPSSFSGTCVGPSDDEGLIGGYTPGAVPTVFPSNGDDVNMGITIPAGSNIILAMHYPHGSAGEIDETSIRLFFYEEDIAVREVSTYPVLSNWSFFLPSNQITDIDASWGPVPEDWSVLSTFPHMHLLGKEIMSYAETPNNETIPLIRINQWDFEWQEFFFFDQIQKIPQGSTLYAEGAFNNTSGNSHNPNDPPQPVTPGLNTTDEMFLVYFHYLPYEDGDEDLDIEELTNITNIEEQGLTEPGSLIVYPNPSDGDFQFELSLSSNAAVSLFIYDCQGKLVAEVLNKIQFGAGLEKISWSPIGLSSGMYHYSLMVNGVSSSGKIMVK